MPDLQRNDVFVRFKPYDPRRPRRAPNITNEQWDFYKPLIIDLHNAGITRTQMLKLLRTEHDFRPSNAQLISRLGIWGLTLHNRFQHQRHSQLDYQEVTVGTEMSSVDANNPQELAPQNIESSTDPLNPNFDNSSPYFVGQSQQNVETMIESGYTDGQAATWIEDLFQDLHIETLTAKQTCFSDLVGIPNSVCEGYDPLVVEFIDTIYSQPERFLQGRPSTSLMRGMVNHFGFNELEAFQQRLEEINAKSPNHSESIACYHALAKIVCAPVGELLDILEKANEGFLTIEPSNFFESFSFLADVLSRIGFRVWSRKLYRYLLYCLLATPYLCQSIHVDVVQSYLLLLSTPSALDQAAAKFGSKGTFVVPPKDHGGRLTSTWEDRHEICMGDLSSSIQQRLNHFHNCHLFNYFVVRIRIFLVFVIDSRGHEISKILARDQAYKAYLELLSLMLMYWDICKNVVTGNSPPVCIICANSCWEQGCRSLIVYLATDALVDVFSKRPWVDRSKHLADGQERRLRLKEKLQDHIWKSSEQSDWACFLDGQTSPLNNTLFSEVDDDDGDLLGFGISLVDLFTVYAGLPLISQRFVGGHATVSVYGRWERLSDADFRTKNLAIEVLHLLPPRLTVCDILLANARLRRLRKSAHLQPDKIMSSSYRDIELAFRYGPEESYDGNITIDACVKTIAHLRRFRNVNLTHFFGIRHGVVRRDIQR
ncbi:hypothetical protein H2198_004198 [Neophaeococcomyces mojaviensis]|uniref:Uncharacterized protein n=1 Tax=Neophaeococcomyces mojaviensis TaxID=3383035 RepID=A0ACC3A9D7_9EURO|nr:hypothetical protein H2198_004198 [Knufia sp. JES_112]